MIFLSYLHVPYINKLNLVRESNLAQDNVSLFRKKVAYLFMLQFFSLLEISGYLLIKMSRYMKGYFRRTNMKKNRATLLENIKFTHQAFGLQ